MLNNPVGAMIPNFDNGGGSTGGGSGLPIGGDDQQASLSRLGGGTTVRPYWTQPMGTNALTLKPVNVQPYWTQPASPVTLPKRKTQIQGEEAPAFFETPKPMQASGIYAAPEQALLYYMQRGEVNQIPSNMADSMGLTSVLQDPNSGWVMKNGQWTQTTQTDTGAITGAQNIGGQTLYKTESGARLDQSGNVVWDPATATRDVYGGQFIAEGTTKWERGKDGKVRRVVWQNGRKQTVRGGGGGGSAPVSKPKPRAQFTGGYGVVNFNTGSG